MAWYSLAWTRVPMPSFFGYILRYSLPFLVTVFLVMTWIFFV